MLEGPLPFHDGPVGHGEGAHARRARVGPGPLVPDGRDVQHAPRGRVEEGADLRLGDAPRVRPGVRVRVGEAAEVEAPAAARDLRGTRIFEPMRA